MARVLLNEAGPGGPALIVLAGATVQGDELRFAEAARSVLEGPPRPVYLDFERLNSITHELAREVTRLRRTVHDRDGELTFCGLNVVVRWVLERGFGVLSLDEGALPPEFSDVPPPPPEPPVPRLHKPTDTARPVGPSVEAIRALLNGSDRPADWAGPLDTLVSTSGLGSRVHLFVRGGDALRLVSRADHAFEADGWLGSLLAAAGRVLDVNEVGDGLSLTERAALLWSGAELLVPAVAGGRLLGVITLISGRPGGYQSLRSGELLALTLFGELLGARLAALPETPAAAPAPAAEPVAEETTEREPVLV